MSHNGVIWRPGEKQAFFISVPGGEPLEAYAVCGRKPGKTLAVTAGVHGCEYVGILAVRKFLETVDPEALTGRIVVLPLLNPGGFYQGVKQIMPEDGKNLNRVFPGDLKGSHSQRVAAIVEREVYPQADFLIDLHGGDWNEDLCPLVFFPAAAGERVERESRAAARWMKVPYRVASSSKNGLYSWAAQRGIPTILLERGCRGVWSQEEVEADVEDLFRLLKGLGMLEGEPEPLPQEEIRRAVYLEAEREGFWFPAVRAGMEIAKGESLGQLRKPDGTLIKDCRAEFDGVVLYHTVTLGVQPGEPLAAYGETRQKKLEKF